MNGLHAFWDEFIVKNPGLSAVRSPAIDEILVNEIAFVEGVDDFIEVFGMGWFCFEGSAVGCVEGVNLFCREWLLCFLLRAERGDCPECCDLVGFFDTRDGGDLVQWFLGLLWNCVGGGVGKMGIECS